MTIFKSFPFVVGLFLIAYSLLVLLFPPKFLNFWYGIHTKMTKKNSVIWSAGQKLFAYAIFGIGLVSIVLSILHFKSEDSPSPIIWIIGLWALSRFIVDKILEKKFS